MTELLKGGLVEAASTKQPSESNHHKREREKREREIE
jgi:hypothetical protein